MLVSDMFDSCDKCSCYLKYQTCLKFFHNFSSQIALETENALGCVFGDDLTDGNSTIIWYWLDVNPLLDPMLFKMS